MTDPPSEAGAVQTIVIAVYALPDLVGVPGAPGVDAITKLDAVEAAD